MDRITWSDFQKYNPSRAPRWRYERVRQLVDARPRPLPPVRNRDDKWIRAARNFLLELQRVNRLIRESESPEYHRRSLWETDKNALGLYVAYEMGTNAQHERTRAEIEARILAKQTDDEIAELLGLLPQSIRWYEALFFHVRDRLKHKAYITGQVLYPNMMSSGPEQLTLNASAKFFGYFAGTTVLSAVLDAYDANLSLPKDGEPVAEFMGNLFTSTLHTRSAEWMKSFEVNRYNVMRLFELNGKMIELALTARRDKESLTELESRVENFFAEVPWATSDRREERLKDSPFSGYVGQTTEPRAHEYYDIIEGNATPELDLLRDQEFPHIQD